MTDALAIKGGAKAVQIEDPEQWQRPIEREIELTSKLIREGFVSGAGKGFPLEFEEAFARHTGADYCLTVTNGSSGLQSAYYAAGVDSRSEVITSVAGYMGSYAGALHLGATPVFADIDPETLLMDPKDVEKRVTIKTRAINIVHMNGKVCDMDAFQALSNKYGIPLIEDAAHATGAEWGGKKMGNISDITVFSLQGSNPKDKPVSGGEGGVVTTNNEDYYQAQLAYCHLHRAGLMDDLKDSIYEDLDEEVLGLKWRAHPLALALATVSLESLDYRNARMNEYREEVLNTLSDIPGIELVKTHEKAKMGGFFSGMQIIYNKWELSGLDARTFVEALNAEGAEIEGPSLRPAIYGPGSYLEHIRPLVRDSEQGKKLRKESWRYNAPFDERFKGYNVGDFPVAESLSKKVLSIPALIEPKEGFLEQYVGAFRKVASQSHSLLRR